MYAPNPVFTGILGNAPRQVKRATEQVARHAKLKKNFARVMMFTFVPSIVAAGMEYLALRFVEHAEQSLCEQSVWLKGIAQKIRESELRDSPLDPEMKLNALLIEAQEIQIELRAEAVQAKEALIKGAPRAKKLATAFERLVSVTADVFEATDELKWAVGEHDASVSKHADGFVAQTPDELKAILERI